MSFILVNDIQQKLKSSLFGPNWVHLATAKIPSTNITRERFFMLLMNQTDSQVYIEEYVDAPLFFKKIEDNNLWKDLYLFFIEKKLLSIGINQEFKIAKKT